MSAAGTYVKNQINTANAAIYESDEQDEDEESYEFLQFNHENDNEDIPDGQDPIMVMFNHEHDTEDLPEGQDPIMVDTSRFSGRSIGDFVQTEEEDNDFEEQDVVLMRYTVSHHEDDTDDIAIELSPDSYDSKHSKQWNMAVEKQAKDLENQIQLEDNMKESAIKAKKDSELHAAWVAKNEADEKHKMEELKKHP